jgi:hypothetical protein
VLLKYNQLNTEINELTRECRGLILDDTNWDVVCYSMKRFPNYGEGWGDKVDFSTARVYTKEDGSLIQLYYYDGRWNCSTSGTPDASGQVLNTDKTFADLFWGVWDKLGYKLPEDTNNCYFFELMTKYNRVVVRHTEPRLVLLGGRRLSDFKELNPVVEAHINGWECVKIHNFGSLEEVIETANKLEGLKDEGFVLCDENFNRCKIKSKDYVAIAHLKEGFTTRRLLEIVRGNEGGEFVQYYPEYKDLYHEIKAKYERLLGQMEGYYEAIKDIDDKKQFALKATTQKFSGSLFGVKNGKFKDFRHALAEMNLKQLEEWLGLKFLEL